MMKNVVVIFALAFLLLPVSAQAMSCAKQGPSVAIQKYDVIFVGRALLGKTNIPVKPLTEKIRAANGYTEFAVLKTYKGTLPKTVRVYYELVSAVGGEVSFAKNWRGIIFAGQDGLTGRLFTSYCSPSIFFGPNGKHLTGAETQEELERFYGSVRALDEEVEAAQRNGAPVPVVAYMQKGNILEQYKDYPRALDAYAAVLQSIHQNSEEGGKDIEFAQFPFLPQPVEKTDIALREQNCSGIYAPAENTPAFLKTLPKSAAFQNYVSNLKPFLAYGRTLYHLGQYEAALRPLCLANDDHWRTLALQRLELNGEGKAE